MYSLKQIINRLVKESPASEVSDRKSDLPGNVFLPRDKPLEPDPHRIGPHFVFTKDVFAGRNVVKIFRNSRAIKVQLHESVLQPATFNPLFPRLLKVLQFYPMGVALILDNAEKTYGRAMFHLNLGDGGLEKTPKFEADTNYFAFCRRKGQTAIGLIPDPFTLGDMSESIQFPDYKDVKDAKLVYEQRSPLIFWRGSTTGKANMSNVRSNQRIRFCMDALGFPQSCDAKISNVVQFSDNTGVFNILRDAGVMAHRVRESEFSRYMATIDLDGNSSAWGTLRKYLNLVHIIKPSGDFEMFYNVGQPANTFTGVDGLDDVFQYLQLENSFPDNFDVAWRGYRFAHDIRQKITAGEATIFPVI